MEALRHWYSTPAIIGLTFLAADAFAARNATGIVMLQLSALVLGFGVAWALDFQLVKQIEAERSLFDSLAQRDAPDGGGAITNAAM